jgi:hypothetical protein
MSNVLMNLGTLTTNDINLFLDCPRSYLISCSTDKEPKEQKDRYDLAIHKAISYFWWKIRDGNLVTLKELRRRFSDIADVDKEYLLRGAEELYYFYEYYKDEPGIPILIDEDREIDFGICKVLVHFDLVRTIGNSLMAEIVDFRTGKQPKNRDLSLMNDISLTLMSYGFRKLFKVEERRLVVSYKDKAYFITKDENDFKLLEKTIENIAICIKNNIYLPKSDCRGCKYQIPCVKGVSF